MALRLLGRVILSLSLFLLSRNFLHPFYLSFFSSPYNIVCILSWIYETVISLIRAKLCLDRFGESGVFRPWQLFVSRLLRQKYNMKVACGPLLIQNSRKKHVTRFAGINFVSNLHFVAYRWSSASFRLTALAAGAQNIFSPRIMSPSASTIFPEMERFFRHFIKLMKLRLRRLCAIFWTWRGGVHEGLRK